MLTLPQCLNMKKGPTCVALDTADPSGPRTLCFPDILVDLSKKQSLGLTKSICPKSHSGKLFIKVKYWNWQVFQRVYCFAIAVKFLAYFLIAFT